MSEKMKCARCGKRFKQANRKQVMCADCLAKERAARKSGAQLIPSSAGASRAGRSPRASEAAAPSPSITIVQATPPPEHGAFGPQARHAEQRPSRPASETHPAAMPSVSPAPQHQPQAVVNAPPPHRQAAPTTPTKPGRMNGQPYLNKQPAQTGQSEKRLRQPRQQTPAFQLTDELRAAIEQRYLELSQPVEFDGIRTQIAGELNVPKPTVKQVIRELRASRQLPSWWELQAYKGNDETLARIRERYLPLLPLPPIGVHKQIASDLGLDAPQVYQAIRRLRAELKLPQYNPPTSHAPEAPGDASRGASGETPDGVSGAEVPGNSDTGSKVAIHPE